MSTVALLWLKTPLPFAEVGSRFCEAVGGRSSTNDHERWAMSTESAVLPGTTDWVLQEDRSTADPRFPNAYDAYTHQVDVERRFDSGPPDDDAVWFVREIAPLLGWQAMTIRDHSPGPDLVWTPTHGHTELELSVPDLSVLPPWVF